MTHSRTTAALVAAFLAFTFVLSTSSFAVERVLVVGDSITGHSMNLPYGYGHEVRNALKESNADVEFVPLGGSGQTIFSWRNIIKRSYTDNFRLDIEGIMVKEEFDKGADSILVHLGMNDALQPSIPSDEEGFKSWRAEYKSLVADLRARVPNVKRVILTPPTLLTENPYALKNVFMDRLAKIVDDVAQEENCEFYDARQEFKEHFIYARTRNPEFRITLDFVHPNQFGHQIMTYSFLKALKLNEIAEKYYQDKVDPILREVDDKPALALFVNDVKLDSKALPDDKNDLVPIEIVGRIFNVKIDELNLEADKLVVKKIEETNPGEFRATLDAPILSFPTTILVNCGTKPVKARLNAPYFATTGVPMKSYQYPALDKFPSDQTQTELDTLLAAGKNPLATSAGASKEWFAYYPTADKTGADNPNAIDLADLAPANAFDAAYVIRYVVSPKAQRATLKLHTEGFSTTTYQRVYLNGREIYFDCLSPRSPKWQDSVEVELHAGLNLLGARVDHTHWQWAVSFSFEGADGHTF